MMIVAPKRLPKETWARIREDYLVGLTAPWLAVQYGTSVAAIRKRATVEGWSRAACLQPSLAGPGPMLARRIGAIEPGQAAGAPADGPALPEDAVPEAGTLLVEGLRAMRRAFQQDRVKDAEQLLALVDRVASWSPPEPEGPPPPRGRFRETILAEPELFTKVMLDVWGWAREIAEAALHEPGREVAAPFARLVVKWRAEFLGEGAAAEDLERLRAAGGEAYAAVFGDEGEVREGPVLPTSAVDEPPFSLEGRRAGDEGEHTAITADGA